MNCKNCNNKSCIINNTSNELNVDCPNFEFATTCFKCGGILDKRETKKIFVNRVMFHRCNHCKAVVKLD